MIVSSTTVSTSNYTELPNSSPSEDADSLTVPHAYVLEMLKKLNQPSLEARENEQNQLNRIHRLVQRHHKQTGLLGIIARLILRIWPSLRARLERLDKITESMKLFPWEDLYLDCQYEVCLKLTLQEMGRISQTNKSAYKVIAGFLLQIANQIAPHIKKRSKYPLKAILEISKIENNEASLEDHGKAIYAAFGSIFKLLPAPKGLRYNQIAPFLTDAIEEANRLNLGFSRFINISQRAKRCNLSVDDFLLILQGIETGATSFSTVHEAFKDDPESCLTALRFSSRNLSHISQRVRKNRGFMLRAARIPGVFNHIIDLTTGNDPEIALRAIRSGYLHIASLGNNLLQNRRFILKICNIQDLFRHLTETYTDDEEVVLKTLQSSPSNITFVSPNLRNNPDFALRIPNLGEAFKYLGNTCKDDEEVALKAIQLNPHNFVYVSLILKNNRNFALRMPNLGEIFQNLGDTCKDDEEVALKAVKLNKQNMAFISSKLQRDKDFALKVIELNYQNFFHLDDDLKNNRDFALAAYRCKPIIYIHRRLLKDPEIALEAIKGDSRNFKHASAYHNNPSFIQRALEANPAIAIYLIADRKAVNALSLVSDSGHWSQIFSAVGITEMRI